MTDYHRRHFQYAAAHWHRRFLGNSYRLSYQALDSLGCRPLQIRQPRVLLCGVGAAATAQEFAAFLAARQRRTRLMILDVVPSPLIASRAALEGRSRLGSVAFIRADARALPFADDSIDLIETDFLLQFMTPADRGRVLREWARVLRPGGGLMSRDWITRERGLDPLWDALRRATLRLVLGASTQSLSARELREALREAGFRATVVRLGRIPLVHLIAGVTAGSA